MTRSDHCRDDWEDHDHVAQTVFNPHGYLIPVVLVTAPERLEIIAAIHETLADVDAS